MAKRPKKVAAPPREPAAVVGLEYDARRAGREQTVAALRGGRTPLTLVEVAAHGARVAEEAVRQAVRAGPPPRLACKEGCDWCCHLTVGVSAPEVFRILDHLRQTLSPEAFAALRERVAERDERRRQFKAERRVEPRLPCALLVEHRCAAYPVRPLTCRGFNSSDAARCERFVSEPGATTVPAFAPQLRLTTFTLDGLRAGLTESGLQGDRLELTAALRITLEGADTAERFLAGEAVFAAARLE
jgi:Fe-S-cluster containining protein